MVGKGGFPRLRWLLTCYLSTCRGSEPFTIHDLRFTIPLDDYRSNRSPRVSTRRGRDQRAGNDEALACSRDRVGAVSTPGSS
jgi:hypothetical protein